MIRKAVVLLRVKYLEQRTRRISAIILRQLIHLIEYHYRVRRAAALHAFHNPARHRTDVSPSVSADLCLIPDTAKTDPHIFAMQRPRNALPDTRLAGAWRSDKEQD